MTSEALRIFRLSTENLDDREFAVVREQLAREMRARAAQCSGAYPLLFSSLNGDDLADAWLWVESESRARAQDAMAPP